MKDKAKKAKSVQRARVTRVEDLDAQAVAARLDDLAAMLRTGHVALSDGEETVDLALDGDLELRLRARSGRKKRVLTLRLVSRGSLDAARESTAPAGVFGAGSEVAAATMPDEFTF